MISFSVVQEKKAAAVVFVGLHKCHPHKLKFMLVGSVHTQSRGCWEYSGLTVFLGPRT